LPCPFLPLVPKEEEEEFARVRDPESAEAEAEAEVSEPVHERITIGARRLMQQMNAPPLGAFFETLTEEMSGTVDARAKEFFEQFGPDTGAVFPKFAKEFVHGIARSSSVRGARGLARVEDVAARATRLAANRATGVARTQGRGGFHFDAGRELRSLLSFSKRKLGGITGFPFSARQ